MIIQAAIADIQSSCVLHFNFIIILAVIIVVFLSNYDTNLINNNYNVNLF